MSLIKAYRHYKGGLYLVVDSVNHRGGRLVVYRCLKDRRLYGRPEVMFHDEVVTQHYNGPRFAEIDGLDDEIAVERGHYLQAADFDVIHLETDEVMRVRIDPTRKVSTKE